MKVFSVTEIEMTPYGENMCDGASYGLFYTMDAAKAYVKELREAHRNEYRDKKTGKLPRYMSMPKWVVRAQEVKHYPNKSKRA